MLIRCSGFLQELLKSDLPHPEITLQFSGKRSVGDLVQSLGIPHTEIGRVLVNNLEVAHSFQVIEKDIVQVFPIESISLYAGTNNHALLCDVHLWKLARRLRIMGFDTAFNPRWEDEELADISFKEHRILLTRDRGLLMRGRVEQGVLIRWPHVRQQIRQVIQRLGPPDQNQLFSRCTMCNEKVETVTIESNFFKESLSKTIPPKVRARHREFKYCSICQKAYWNGTHYQKLIAELDVFLTGHTKE